MQPSHSGNTFNKLLCLFTGKSESTNLLMILIVILYIFVTVLFIIKLLENYSTIKSFFVRMWESVKRQCAISKVYEPQLIL